jgi:Flavin containing amine oxidoreductase
MNIGLMNDLRQRTMDTGASAETLREFDVLFNETGLGSYFTADYQLAMERMADSIGTVHTNVLVTKIMKSGGHILVTADSGISSTFDFVVLTIQPSQIVEILDHADFSDHVQALRKIESGAVGVRIIHADNLPFAYPPHTQRPFDLADPAATLGIFDISQLSLRDSLHLNRRRKRAGWLSVAYPVYNTSSWNIHADYLSNIPSLNKKVYPWVKATASFPAARRQIVELQGRGNLFVTGHSLTGVNKASELQMTNALYLCDQCFGALPPWKHYFSAPLLPDCNDDDAFRRVSGPLEAVNKSIKSMLGSFVLVLVVRVFGTHIFE